MKGNFNSIIKAEQPVLVDFSAEWCGPCKTQSPILLDVAHDLNGKLRIIKIDVDKNPEIANRFQIQSVPTLALYKKGKIIWRQSGVVDKSRLISILQDYL